METHKKERKREREVGMIKPLMITHTDSGSLEINWLSTIVNAFSKFLGQTGRQHNGVYFHLVCPVLRNFGMGCFSIQFIHMIL